MAHENPWPGDKARARTPLRILNIFHWQGFCKDVAITIDPGLFVN